MHPMRALLVSCAVAPALLLLYAAPQERSNEASGQVQRVASMHLPNLVQVHPRVLSGGLPRGDDAFAELRDRGVKTVISVDGARPDAATAEKFGIRYVHLPHGYDGVPDHRVWELAKAVCTLEGPIYIHCHHGKHRSPAAVAAACVAVGLLPGSDAVSVLKLAGTNPHYRGLYEAARGAERLDPSALANLKVEFRSAVDVAPMAQAMVAIEHTHDRLKAFAAAEWQAPRDQPDLDAAHEALLLREHFTELLRTDAVLHESDEFRSLLRESELASEGLERALRSGDRAASSSKESPTDPSPQEGPAGAAGDFLARITAHCQTCHLQFRDVARVRK